MADTNTELFKRLRGRYADAIQDDPELRRFFDSFEAIRRDRYSFYLRLKNQTVCLGYVVGMIDQNIHGLQQELERGRQEVADFEKVEEEAGS
jgi:hypothetical protein